MGAQRVIWTFLWRNGQSGKGEFVLRWFQTSQTRGQQYSNASPFSVPWCNVCMCTIVFTYGKNTMVHINTYLCLYICVSLCVYAYNMLAHLPNPPTHTHTHTHNYVYAYIFMSIFVCGGCTNIYIYIFMHPRTQYIYIYIYTHIYACTRTHNCLYTCKRTYILKIYAYIWKRIL